MRQIKHIKTRVILIPIMVINFLFQFFIAIIFQMFGMFMALFMSIMMIITPTDEERDWSLVIYVLTFGLKFPFIWWYRYFKFGEFTFPEQ